ncbi:MAG: hypothetical protein JWM21_2655 [Acidobacteria bacterium]|nr:hypothetical protein [Acidobacteriota bacterium]
MLRRPVARFQTRTLALLIITAVCVFLALGITSSARVAKHLRATPFQDPQIASPDSISTTMYGGNGGHGNSDSINDGSLVTLDQANASVTVVGHPNGILRLTGLAFDSTGKLFASTTGGGGFPPPPPPLTSTLIVLDPTNGALVSTIGPIKDGAAGPAISIADLAIQPGTDTLFGMRAPNDGGGGQGKLYTINKTTGVATLVGNTNTFFGSIAFAPDGTLYESAADLNFMTGEDINIRFMKVNPANAAIITSVSAAHFFGALGVRPTDSVIFAGTGDEHQIFTVVPATGASTLIGDTGQNFVGAIAFSPVTTVGVNNYRQTDLVSDVPSLAQILDPRLVNPWGIAESATSPFWVANQGTSTATLYGGDVGGNPLTKNTLNVTIPGGVPTGTVFNGGSDFVITAGGGTGPARFLFASLSGNITAWRAGTAAIIAASHPGHVYTGLAIGNNGVANFLYAADFANRKIDVYDKNFALATLAGNFTDPTLPAGYAPFNAQNLGGKIYVMYAKVDPATGEDEAGVGNGFVSTFDTNGNFLQRLISNGALNSPWGVTLAPTSFGKFGDTLLVGNFGDGRINAYAPTTGAFLGTLNDQSGHVLEIEKLWAITFGNGVGGGDQNTLYFNAGLGDEDHGLVGKLQPAITPFISFQLSADNYVAGEGSGFVTITVNRVGEVGQPATVNFSTYTESSPGHASAANDFIPTGGVLRFAAGETSKTFRVLIIDDTRLEGDEEFEVQLSNPTGAGLGFPTHADVKIAENDSPSSISPAQKTFVAALDGGHEVPPHATNGTGTGIVIITDEATGAAKMSLAFSGLTSNAVAAHIHGPAVDGQNAAVLFPITVPSATSGSANDVAFTMTPTQISQLKNGLFYFNIHTTNFPGGEIRGQINFNPIDEAGYFVRQNYLDFLNRNPDAAGLSYWTGQITGCGVNTLCISNRRIDVSAAFFFAQEFQNKDFFVYRVRKASFGTLPTLSQFTFDRTTIGTGSAADMKTFTETFVQNGEFIGMYPTTQSGSQFIDSLIATVLAGSGVDLSSRKPDLENEYLLEASQTASRARVLRRLVGYPEFTNAEFNRAFVATEYYGYLRRTPDAAGFNFWLGVLNANAGNFRSMVCSFITSDEYQRRFGTLVTRRNAECATVAP